MHHVGFAMLIRQLLTQPLADLCQPRDLGLLVYKLLILDVLVQDIAEETDPEVRAKVPLALLISLRIGVPAQSSQHCDQCVRGKG